MSIIADDREKEVNNYLECTVERLSVGDFLIMSDKPLMIIERKTWKDLEASIIDGRSDAQIEAMINARKEYGCKLLFIIEGKVFNDKDKKVRNLTYGILMTKLRHCLVRHDIPFIQTRNEQHTAETIKEFASDFLADHAITGGTPANLKGIRKKSDEEILREIWSSLNGISAVNAHIFLYKYKLAELYLSADDLDIFKVSRLNLSDIKYDSGRSIGEKKAKEIINSIPLCQKQVLSSIPKIGVKKAELILEATDMYKLSKMQEKEMIKYFDNLKIGIGQKLSKSIHYFLHLRLEHRHSVTPFQQLMEISHTGTKQYITGLFGGNIEYLKWLVYLLNDRYTSVEANINNNEDSSV